MLQKSYEIVTARARTADRGPRESAQSGGSGAGQLQLIVSVTL